MPELLHDLSLLEEGLGRHGASLQRLDGHLSGAVPRACVVVGRGGVTTAENNSYEFTGGANKFVLLEETVSRDRESTTNRGSDCRKWIMSQFGHKQTQ